MKFREAQETRMVPVTIDGTTNLVEKKITVRRPRIPRDWDRTGLAAVVGLVLVLTVIAVAWSTVSIGSLLGGGIGLAAATLFDLAWIITVILEYLSRYDDEKRQFPQRLGWVLLAVTMGAIGWDGLLQNSVPLAVVGALVSLLAKVLWLGVMKHIHRPLTDDDQRGWVAAERNKAHAKLALASVKREVARTEMRAALEHLAVEEMHHGYEGADHIEAAQVGPEPEAAPEPETVPDPRHAPGREQSLRQAVDAMARARSIAARDPHSPEWTGAGRAADEALGRALAVGWSVADVLEAEIRLPSPAEMPGRPKTRVSGLVAGSGNAEDVRTDAPARLAKVTSQRHDATTSRQPSVAAGVRALYGMGVSDPAEIARRLSPLYDRPVDLETVARYVRDARRDATPNTPDTTAPQTGRGGYL